MIPLAGAAIEELVCLASFLMTLPNPDSMRILMFRDIFGQICREYRGM
jgi:hypothetical protein